MTTAIWLYGSFARGDATNESDVDILIVGRDTLPLLNSNEAFQGHHLAISQYSWLEMERMASYGSVFLHHLRNEARPLISNPAADGRLTAILRRVAQYQQADADITAFKVTLDDVRHASRRDCAPAYELAVLGSVARHAAVLACYLSGGPIYGRDAAFSALQKVLALPYDPYTQLRDIYRFRLAEERGKPVPADATLEALLLALEMMNDIVNRIGELARGYTRAMPS